MIDQIRVMRTTLLVDISDTVLLEIWVKFNRPVAKTFAASLFNYRCRIGDETRPRSGIINFHQNP